MPKSRHTSLIPSPSSKRATNRRRSSITEVSLHGIDTSRPNTEKCNPCLRYELSPISQVGHQRFRRSLAHQAPAAHTPASFSSSLGPLPLFLPSAPLELRHPRV